MTNEGTPSGDQGEHDHADRIRTLFAEAIELPESKRTAFIQAQCSDDTALAGELLEMLRGHAETVRDPSGGGGPSSLGHQASTHLQPGESLGPFKILQQLGEGGFGEVYLAQQTAPVRRRVALKVIKLGMDTRSVIARFEAERQALAMMDDPGIARVYEAGATPQGRPYFVMEYVKGEPITRYCDREKLDTTQRLELFIKVCNAIQHAHQKGVIHRDIKPGNILVTIDDRDQPQPKVIDFGIAKATSQQLTDKTLYTQQGMLIGTPEYMSPEQAEMTGTDIDTRSDVYSLGVLLYELLTGRVPFDLSDLRKAGQAEILRIIREEEPPRPSTKLTTIEPSEGTRIAEARRTRLGELQSALRRELEWIPLKALRKARTERYSSAEALGKDVGRYLAGEPLEAGPESTGYRMRKFVARRRVPIAVGGVFAAMLVAATVVSLWFAVEAEERADELEAVSAFQSEMLGGIEIHAVGIDLMQDLQDRFEKSLASTDLAEELQAERVDAFRRDLAWVNATDASAAMIDRTILAPAITAIDEQFQDQPLLDARLRTTLASVYGDMGKYDDAEPLLREALDARRPVLGDEHPSTLTSINNMGILLNSQGKYDDALPYYTAALEGRRRVLGDEHPSTLDSINNMGILLNFQGKYDDALPYYTEALEGYRRVLGDEHPSTLDSINAMGSLLYMQGKYDDALPYYTAALEGRRRVLGDEHPSTLNSIHNMGNLLAKQGKYDEALPYYTEALEGQRRVLVNEHPSTLESINAMGSLLYMQGKYDDALPYYTAALEGRRRVLGDEHPSTLDSISNMGNLLERQGKYDQALPYYTEALETSRRVLWDEHPETLNSISNMGLMFVHQGKYDDAEPLIRKGLDGMRRTLGNEHLHTLNSIAAMGHMLYSQGKYDEAEPLLREALDGYRRTLGDETWTLYFVEQLLSLYSAWDIAEPGQGHAEKADALRQEFLE